MKLPMTMFAPPLVCVLAAFSALSLGCTEAPKKEALPAGQPVTAAPTPTAAANSPADDAKAAAEIFATRCTPCHGPQGGGDGPASAGLTPKPANFSSAEWQAKVTDEHIEKIIQYGGSAVGKSPAMPPNPDLMDKESLVKALRAYVRGLKK